MTSVGDLAKARGRTVDEVLAACRAANVIAWSAHAPLDDKERVAVEAVLDAPPPPPPGPPGYAPIGAAGSQPPPPTGPPLSGHLPPPPPSPGSSSRMPWWKIALPVLGGVLLIGQVALSVLGDDIVTDRDRDRLRNEVQDVADAGFEQDIDEELGTFALAVGDCFDDRSDIAVGGRGEARVVEVDCAGPHDAEVYLLTEFPAGSGVDYVGDESLFLFADAACLGGYGDFVGGPYPSGGLDVLQLHPSPDSWDVVDDRRVVCAVTPVDGSSLTGTAQGRGVGG